ncbi:MAG: SCP2 sterol-binding domain-containing protein [Candidatus Thorarchaeota archaeon]
MASKEEVKEAINKWLSKMDDPEVADEFEDYNKTLQFFFPDINYKIKMIFQDKKAKLEEGFDDKAELSLEMDSNDFLGINDGSVDPMELFMDGAIIIKGDMNAIQRLEVFMDL